MNTTITRPAQTPIIFPATLDDLLVQRRAASILAMDACIRPEITNVSVSRQADWVDRLNARIAQVVS